MPLQHRRGCGRWRPCAWGTGSPTTQIERGAPDRQPAARRRRERAGSRAGSASRRRRRATDHARRCREGLSWHRRRQPPIRSSPIKRLRVGRAIAAGLDLRLADRSEAGPAAAPAPRHAAGGRAVDAETARAAATGDADRHGTFSTQTASDARAFRSSSGMADRPVGDYPRSTFHHLHRTSITHAGDARARSRPTAWCSRMARERNAPAAGAPPSATTAGVQVGRHRDRALSRVALPDRVPSLCRDDDGLVDGGARRIWRR